jgi:hypothetical protein
LPRVQRQCYQARRSPPRDGEPSRPSTPGGGRIDPPANGIRSKRSGPRRSRFPRGPRGTRPKLRAEVSSDPAVINPIIGIVGGCACAATGHAAALHSPAMNSRRRIGHASSRFGGSLSWPRMQGNGLLRGKRGRRAAETRDEPPPSHLRPRVVGEPRGPRGLGTGFDPSRNGLFLSLRGSLMRFPARKGLGAPKGLRLPCGRRTRQSTTPRHQRKMSHGFP